MQLSTTISNYLLSAPSASSSGRTVQDIAEYIPRSVLDWCDALKTEFNGSWFNDPHYMVQIQSLFQNAIPAEERDLCDEHFLDMLKHISVESESKSLQSTALLGILSGRLNINKARDIFDGDPLAVKAVCQLAAELINEKPQQEQEHEQGDHVVAGLSR